MDTLRQDLRFALRTLARSPGFVVVAVLSLAVGVGANTTIFTLLNAIFLAPLPVDRPAELVAVYTTDDANTGGLGGLLAMSRPNLDDFREQNDVLADMAGYTLPNSVSVSVSNDPQHAFAEMVTGSYFQVLGVRPAQGRFFLPEEGTVGGHAVVVISHGFWRRRLGADPAAPGRTLSLNGTTFTVVGVAPEGFRGVNSLISPDLWVPSTMYASVLPAQSRGLIDERRALLFYVAGRLKPGVAPREAEANLKTIAAALERQYPAPNQGRSVTVRPLAQATLFPALREAFLVGGGFLMAIVGLVLLIACSNVANLMVARASARRQEVAVRVALGAKRGRLVRQLLTESMLIAAAAGLLGFLLAVAGRSAIWSMRPPLVAENVVDLTLDTRVLLFTMVVSVLTGFLFGLIPALQASRPDVVDALKEGHRSGGPGRRGLLLSNTLVVVQVALSIVALVAAGLFVRGLQRANEIEVGFDVDRVGMVAVNPGQGGYKDARLSHFYALVQDRVALLPGIESSVWATGAPLTRTSLRTILREGEDPASNVDRNLAVVTVTSPGYFKTLGIPLLRGRDFSALDDEGSVRVAVVNDSFADRVWPGQEALGKRFRFYTNEFPHEVVGVAKTVKYQTVGEEPRPAFYIPLAQNPADAMVLLVRSVGRPGSFLGDIQQEVRALDSQVPVTSPYPMRDVLQQSLWPARLAAGILGVLGTVALALASIGLYGVMAYSVAQRTREIGVRMALGAEGSHILRMVMRQALRLTVIGLLIGIACAVAVARVVTGLLFGLSTIDPVTFGGVGVLLVLVALLAGWMPAWRASRLDPLHALR